MEMGSNLKDMSEFSIPINRSADDAIRGPPLRGFDDFLGFFTVDGQSWKTEFVCLNMPEPLRLPDRAAVEKHFREVHKENIIKPVESHRLVGTAARSLRSPDLARLVRQVWEDQRRFPLQLATVLSQQFASLGLQFFKVHKTVTHVSVARPHFLDLETTPVSEGVKRIVDFINANAKGTRRKLMEALAPTPAPAVIAVPSPEAEAAPAPAAAAEPTPEQTAVISDLHWLIHQGHVIEFANGILETAKKPLPRPPKPEAKPAEPTIEEPTTIESAEAVVPTPESEETQEPLAASEAADSAAEPAPALEAVSSETTLPTSAGEAPAETPAAPAEAKDS